jgi:hypothetical protein
LNEVDTLSLCHDIGQRERARDLYDRNTYAVEARDRAHAGDAKLTPLSQDSMDQADRVRGRELLPRVRTIHA